MADGSAYEPGLWRVDKQVLRTPEKDGSGTITYAYTPRVAAGTAAGVNDWMMKTVETLADGDLNIVYTNTSGQVLLECKRSADGTEQFIDAYGYDADGHLVMHASPTAITGLDDAASLLAREANANLLGFDPTTRQAEIVNDTAGLVRGWFYHQDQTASPAELGGWPGSVSRVFVQEGDTGERVTVDEANYLTNPSVAP